MTEIIEMDLRNFRRWIRDPVQCLLKQKHAGFALAMISFPVLERLVRGKSGASDSQTNQPFYSALTNCFRALRDPPSGKFPYVAQVFWQGFRNGIVHQASFSGKPATVQGNAQRAAFCVFHPGSGIAIEVRDLKRVIIVDPFAFSETVLELIESDFDSYRKAEQVRDDLAFEHGPWIVSI